MPSLCSVLQLKYMKELEQEKDFLLQGLELIDRAREWYHQRIQLMQEHQRLLGNKRTSAVSLGLLLAVCGFGKQGWEVAGPGAGPMATSCLFFFPILQDFPEGGQSLLGCLVPKLQEVNCCLSDLLSTAGKVKTAHQQLEVVCVILGLILPPLIGGWVDTGAGRVSPSSGKVMGDSQEDSTAGPEMGWRMLKAFRGLREILKKGTPVVKEIRSPTSCDAESATSELAVLLGRNQAHWQECFPILPVELKTL